MSFRGLRNAARLVLVATLAIGPASVARAQGDTHCGPGLSPRFQSGFSDLSLNLGGLMGDAVTCEYSDPIRGLVRQNTTRGLAYWDEATNVPTFTDGFNHWSLTSAGLVAWLGSNRGPLWQFPRPDPDWQIYANARYIFAVQVPQTWEVGDEPQNGDGVKLSVGDPDVTISASGMLYLSDALSLRVEPGFQSQPVVLNDGREATLFMGRRGTHVVQELRLVQAITYFAHPDTPVVYTVFAEGPDSFFEDNQDTLLKVMKSLSVAT